MSAADRERLAVALRYWSNRAEELREFFGRPIAERRACKHMSPYDDASLKYHIELAEDFVVIFTRRLLQEEL